ncbi:hypothetical protein NKI77_06840 [Mesorhizobium opportunistum]|uniref:hypothetical protein n=1 Tax=Mesorhizobium opportunistum TaxID=593909 RepID=UPI0033370DF0
MEPDIFTITDFDPAEDKFAFDAVGLDNDNSAHEFAYLGGVVTVADLGLTASYFTFV